jgi:hypothetical protein
MKILKPIALILLIVGFVIAVIKLILVAICLLIGIVCLGWLFSLLTGKPIPKVQYPKLIANPNGGSNRNRRR